MGKRKTHQGNLTLQFKNTAASPSSRISLTTALPSRNINPPSAGSSANTRGSECHAEIASWASTGGGCSSDAPSSWSVRRAEEKEERESRDIKEDRRWWDGGGE